MRDWNSFGTASNIKFLDADVQRPVASVSAIVEGNIVACGPRESYIENTSIGQRIPIKSSSGDAARTGSSGEGNGSSRVDNKRKADGEHPEDPEREDGKWMRTEENKWKTVGGEEELEDVGEDVRVRFGARRDVESREGSDRDEMD